MRYLVLLLLVLALVVMKELPLYAADGNRTIVILDGEPVYLDSMHGSSAMAERVNKPTKVPAPIKTVVPMLGSHVISSNAEKATDQTFDSLYPGRKDELVLLDFWGPWCGPCVEMLPIMNQLSLKYAGKVRVLELQADECRAIESRFNVYMLPHLFLTRNGKVVHDFSNGYVHAETIENAIAASQLTNIVKTGTNEISVAPLILASYEKIADVVELPPSNRSNRRIVILDGHRVYEDTMDRPSKDVERVKE